MPFSRRVSQILSEHTTPLLVSLLTMLLRGLLQVAALRVLLALRASRNRLLLRLSQTRTSIARGGDYQAADDNQRSIQ